MLHVALLASNNVVVAALLPVMAVLNDLSGRACRFAVIALALISC